MKWLQIGILLCLGLFVGFFIGTLKTSETAIAPISTAIPSTSTAETTSQKKHTKKATPSKLAKEKQKKRTRARPRRGNIDRPDKPWHSHLYYLMQTPEDNVFPGEGKYNTYIVAKYNAFICSVNDMIDKAFKKGVDAIVRDKGIVSRQDREYIFNAVEKERIELYEEYAEHYVGAVIALVDRVESGDAIPKKEWDENYGWAYVNEWKKATEERLQTHVFCIVPGEEYVYTAQVSTVEPELDMKPPHLEKKRTELAEKITEIGFSLYDKQ